jgi:hypothetical protein
MKPLKPNFSAQYCRDLFSINSDGRLICNVDRKPNGRKAGEFAEFMRVGYYAVSISYGGTQKNWLAHRIIWYMINDIWPDGSIDHINGIKTDNRPENLRIVSHRENMRNQKLRSDNKTGLTGLTFVPSNPHWRVIWKEESGKKQRAKHFKTMLEAEEFRSQIKRDYPNAKVWICKAGTTNHPYKVTWYDEGKQKCAFFKTREEAVAFWEKKAQDKVDIGYTKRHALGEYHA